MKSPKRPTMFAKATADPLENFIGELYFKPGLVTAEFKEKVAKTLKMGEFNGTLIKIFMDYEDSHTIIGNGAIVAPGLAICADHVIEPIMKAVKNGGQLKFFALAANKETLDVWNITRHTHVASPNFKTDVSILNLKLASALPPKNEFHYCSMTTRIPKIGEHILISGFKADKTKNIKEGKAYSVPGDIILSSGKVVEIFPEKRDSVFCPGPTIIVQTPTWFGMSGGPVFDQNGYLIGVLTSSEEPIKGEDSFSSVSLIWPAFLIPINTLWPEETVPSEKTSLLKLNGTLTKIQMAENVEFSFNPNDGTVIGIRHKKGNGKQVIEIKL